MNEEPTLEQRIDALERKVESIGSITATLMSNFARERCFDKSKEPYIGDEATAKFVRAWAKHWGIEKVMARIRFDHGVDLVGWVEDSAGREIDIQGAFVSGEIKDCHEYTIDELCGEEDE